MVHQLVLTVRSFFEKLEKWELVRETDSRTKPQKGQAMRKGHLFG
jgi:hypothetical protein